MTVRLATPIVVLALVGACAGPERRPASSPAAAPPPAPSATATSAPVPTGSLASAIREWETRTGDLFKRSARALHQVSEGTDANDEAAIRSGCQQLHDANAVELQRLLPTPDPDLTAELQRMIDDMNVATHACLRFVIARKPDDTTIYQDYLARAVDHLQQAKVILDADLREG